MFKDLGVSGFRVYRVKGFRDLGFRGVGIWGLGGLGVMRSLALRTSGSNRDLPQSLNRMPVLRSPEEAT